MCYIFQQAEVSHCSVSSAARERKKKWPGSCTIRKGENEEVRCGLFANKMKAYRVVSGPSKTSGDVPSSDHSEPS